MSYYSDISIAMKKEDYLELLCHADSELTYLLEQRTAYKKESKDGSIIVLAWEDIDWDRVSGSDYIFTYLDELDREDKPYKMVRTGEVYEDIEIKIRQ